MELALWTVPIVNAVSAAAERPSTEWHFLFGLRRSLEQIVEIHRTRDLLKKKKNTKKKTLFFFW